MLPFLKKYAILKTEFQRSVPFMNKFSIANFKSGSSVHFIGIGGISMSALAEMMLYLGYKVSGSDRSDSEALSKLREKGAEICVGQRKENIKNPDLVCYTAAISEDNPELIRARELNVPVIERAELLGELMTLYKFPLAVAGTHGKTTTTSMLSLILLAAEKDPTILVGGNLPQIEGNYRQGKTDYLVLEACEYVESFLHFHPFLSIITNIEADHLDYFVNLNNIISAFEKFARLNSPLGHIIVCFDDKNIQSIVQNFGKNVVKYGIDAKNCEFVAENIKPNSKKGTNFDVLYMGKPFLSLSLNLSGKHVVYDALACVAAAVSLGIEKEAIKEGLESFTGTKRRFEKLGFFDGVEVVDDYAHHPTEIETTLKSAMEMGYNDVWCIFQPHTYSRTKAFLNEFAEALSLADHVIIADVYPAREKYDGTIHSCDLALLIDKGVYINDFGAIERYIKKNAKKGDLVISMGAGSVTEIGHNLVK